MQEVSLSELLFTGSAMAGPVRIVELPQLPERDAPAAVLVLPPCPVIGIGDARHPFAKQLDMVVETREAAARMAESAMRHPLAAGVVAQLLRLLPGVASEQGLVAESLAYAVLQAGSDHREWIGQLPPRVPQPAGGVVLGREDDELRIELDRAWAGNAIDRAMRDALHEAFALANADETIRRIYLCARGKTFSLGADLAEFGTTADPAEAHAIRMLTLPAREALRCADRFEAHVDGGCVGAGLELAAFARKVTATRRSWFQLPELAMGILPGAGGCVSLTRRIGRQRTLMMILSGRRIGARQALEWGLVDAIVDQDA